MSYLKFVPLSQYDLSYTAKIPLPWNPTIYCLIAAFSAVPMWMSIELTFQIFATFKRYTGLYFYALMFCTWSITIRQVGRVCIYFVPGCNQIFSLVFAMLGWVGTVTGFAVVLYSRLHLVTRNRRILNSVLCMIIFSVFAFHLPTMVAQIGVVTKHQPKWISWYPAMEKMQIVGFTVQETIISTIYVISTHKLISGSYNEKTRKNIKLLILVQVLCVSLDLPFIILSYLDLFLIKVTLASFGYAIKLKLEFIVLNNLLDIAKNGIAFRGIKADIPDEEKGENGEKAQSHNVRIPSISSRWRRASRSPRHSSTAQKRLSDANQVCVADLLDKKPTPVLPRPPTTDGQPKNNSSPSTFNDSITTSSANTDVISRPHQSRQRTDDSLADTEKRYLGQYGIRTMRVP
jgi:hypothetical protein